jgi:hypothetical protein
MIKERSGLIKKFQDDEKVETWIVERHDLTIRLVHLRYGVDLPWIAACFGRDSSP